jgi:tyrosyl-tRNA synthetase
VSASRFVAESLAVFRRGAVDLIEERELAARLARVEGKPGGLRVKLGLDPSSPDLHFGHAVLLKKLGDLQALGHTVVLIVGDATALVGDPSGRNKLRPQLAREEVASNLRTYEEQAALLLDMRRVEVRHNSEWFDALRFEGLLRLLARRTVAQTLAREDFQKRLAADAPIGLHELIYPLMQGWDSVEVRADVELGGTDQLFNLLVGRDLQGQAGQEPQVVLTTPLLDGLDGRKMSKSYGNSIGLTDPPKEIFGKTMRLTDEAMPDWYRLLTDEEEAEWSRRVREEPREAKARLAGHLVALVHDEAEAERQRSAFDRQFVDKELPADIPVLHWPLPSEGSAPGLVVPASMPLPVLLRGLRLATSSSEASRLIKQGGVRIDNEVVLDPGLHLRPPGPAGYLIQVGKRRFARVRLP